MTSVVLYSLTRATLMSPGKDETRVCITYVYVRVYTCMYSTHILLCAIYQNSPACAVFA